MAEFFLDTSAVGNEYQAYADTPTSWAVPQDGNGKAGPGHAAAVAVAEVTFAAIPTTGSVSVYGTTVTLAGVLSAASTSAAATALASSINATATALGAAVSALLLPLNRFVFARVKPGNASTVQIMCRIAGADLNYAGNTSARVVNTLNNAAMTSPVDFAGGADGPWAYLCNDTTVLFGKATTSYGLFPAKAPGPSEPGVNDVIVVRTKRGGADLGFTYTTAVAGININTPSGSTRQFLFDDGTTWAGDNGQFQWLLTVTAVNQALVLANGSSGHLVLSARAKYGLRIVCGTLTAGYSSSVGSVSSICLFQNVLLEQQTSSGSGIKLLGANINAACIFLNSKLILKANVAVAVNQGGYDVNLQILNSIVEWQGLGANATALVPFSAAPNSNLMNLIKLVGSEFIVDGGVYSLASILSGGSNIQSGNLKIVVENCKGAPANPSGGFGAASSASEGLLFAWRDAATGSFRFETPTVTVDWSKASAASYPTLGVTSPDGTPMGVRASWEAGRLGLVRRFPVEVLSLATFYRSASAVKTCSVEMLVPSSEIPSKSQIFMVLTYVDSGGATRVESTEEPFLLALTGGGSTVLGNGVGTGLWVLNGVGSTTSKRLSITTAAAVKQNTEISAKVFIGGLAPTGTRAIYFSPEVRVS